MFPPGAREQVPSRTQQNFFKGTEIYFQGSEIYFQGLEINFKATEKVLSRTMKKMCPKGKGRVMAAKGESVGFKD